MQGIPLGGMGMWYCSENTRLPIQKDGLPLQEQFLGFVASLSLLHQDCCKLQICMTK